VQSFRTTYAGLLILRACFAVFGTGFIHPDEYFQNGEVTAGMLYLRFYRHHTCQSCSPRSNLGLSYFTHLGMGPRLSRAVYLTTILDDRNTFLVHKDVSSK
jgi:hypothetical protein